MKAKLVSLQGTIEAEGTPEELAKFFREYNGWTLTNWPALHIPPTWITPVVTIPSTASGVSSS